MNTTHDRRIQISYATLVSEAERVAQEEAQRADSTFVIAAGTIIGRIATEMVPGDQGGIAAVLVWPGWQQALRRLPTAGVSDAGTPGNGTFAGWLAGLTSEARMRIEEDYGVGHLDLYAAYKAQQARVEERAWHEHAYLAVYCQAREQGLGLQQADGQPSNVGQCLYSLMGYRPAVCGIAAVPERAQIILPEMLDMPGLDVLLQQWRSAYPEAGYWRWRDNCLESLGIDRFLEWIAAWRREVAENRSDE